MSDPQTYISSGILELYVSGELNAQEMAEVNLMAEKYPEIQAEIVAIEEALADVSFAFQRKPKRDLLAGVMDAIEEEQKDISTIPPVQEANIQELTPQKPVNNSFRWMAIAAAIALLVSLAINFRQYQLIKENQAQIATLTQSNQEFADINQRTNNQLQVVSSPLYQVIDLTGQPASPESRARVYYSAAQNKIFLQTGNLKLLDQEMQFQLWAIIDGSPVDAGVFDPQEGLASIKSLTGNIQAFAVTLEPRGGSKTPTLDQMYVLGSVS